MGADALLNRRNVLAALMAVGVLASNAPAWALPGPQRLLNPALLPGLRFRSIVIDTGPMEAKGGRSLVELMRRASVTAFAKAFADRLAPGDKNGLTLRVVLDSASFASDSGGSDDMADSMDYFEGAGLVIGPRGEVLGSYPILSPLQTFASSNRFASDRDYELRAQFLAQHFAYWMRRNMGI